MAVRFALGNDDFRELREENAYYVDKTGFLREMIADLYKVRLFTRPRRFGKTLMLSMMEDFFPSAGTAVHVLRDCGFPRKKSSALSGKISIR